VKNKSNKALQKKNITKIKILPLKKELAIKPIRAIKVFVPAKLGARRRPFRTIT
jgi:hypothetical protein